MPFDIAQLEGLPEDPAWQQLPPIRSTLSLTLEASQVARFGTVRPAGFALVEEARRRWFRELLESRPPELVEFYAAARAYDAGDEGPMEAWVEERVGGSIDPTLRNALDAWM